MRKNGFFTFCSACIPGCGQMYQGYMKRGVSLALWFWGVILLAAVLSLGPLAILLPVIWAYAFFDTFNLRALSPQQRAVFMDDFIPSTAWLQQHRVRNISGSKVFGWVLVGVGALLLYNSLLQPVIYEVLSRMPFGWEIFNRLPALAIGVVVIVLGIRMLSRTKFNPYSAPMEEPDDVVQFGGKETMQAEQAAPAEPDFQVDLKRDMDTEATSGPEGEINLQLEEKPDDE